MSTLVAEISDPEERDNPNVVKAVLSVNAAKKPAHFISPAPPRPPATGRFITISAFTAINAPLWINLSLPPSPLEQREKLEQLRALEAGLSIAAAIVDTVPVGVDTPEDLAHAERVLQKNNH